MLVARWILAFALVLAIPACAEAQSTLLQGGPTTPGRAPMYLNSGSSQAVVQDSGPAGGGGPGLGLSELGVTARGTGTAPYVGQGTGPNGENICDQDAPTTNPSGYHYLCLSANVASGGLISYGAAGSAAQQPLNMKINGTVYPFPFVLSGVVGPGTTVSGDVATWANTSGTLLGDTPVLPAPHGGLGAASLSGYLFGNGASAATASSTIPNSGLATMAADTVKCNATSGSANPTDCTVPQTQTLLNIKTGTNVATLRALTAPADGTTQYVNGYYAAGDGGGGAYTFSASSSASDNGGTVIAPNVGSGRWLRDATSTITPEVFGAKGDGSTIDGTAIGNAITYVSGAPGVQLNFYRKTYCINAALPNIAISGFNMIGLGPRGTHDGGTGSDGTVITACGGSGYTMLTAQPASLANSALSGIKIIGIDFNANGLAGTGLALNSIRLSDIEISERDATSVGVAIGVEVPLAEAADTQNNKFRLDIRQLDGAGADGIPLTLSGDAANTHNVSFNYFEDVHIVTANTSGVMEYGADNNTWALETITVAGSATYSVELFGTNLPTSTGTSAEQFIHFSSNKPILSHAVGMSIDAGPSTLFYLDKSNSSPDPVIETGASFYWQDTTTVITDGSIKTWTPTITSSGGTLGTVSSINDNYQYDGRFIRGTIAFAITTAGSSPTGNINIPLPVAADSNASVSGIEISTGKALIGYILNPSAPTVMSVHYYDNSFAGGNGTTLIISFEYRWN